MKSILTIVLPTFAVLTVMTIVVALRTQAFAELRSVVARRVNEITEKVEEATA